MPVRRVVGESGTASRPLWAVRAAARAPRIAVLAACGLLALVGARALLAPEPQLSAQRRSVTPVDVTARSFAEAFARTYLTWNADEPETRERAIARFVGSDVEPAAGVVVPPRGAQQVSWTAVEGDRAAGERGRIITVAAETSRGPIHLAVPVSRDDRGLLFVSGVPAIVGPPARTSTGAAPPEVEVEDRALRAVGSRVVRNYLAGERDDLAADLAPGAIVSLPELRLKVRSTDAVTWVSEPRRLAVALSASTPAGARLALRYELSVVRLSGRWVVRTIHINPVAREGDQ
jgi:Conjugative transposon protein TcpC